MSVPFEDAPRLACPACRGGLAWQGEVRGGLLHEGRTYGVSVLCEQQSELSDRFAGRPSGANVEPRFEIIHDTPLVEGALAHFVAKISRSYWGGDHSLFLGAVEYARYKEDGQPLLFHGGRYERLGQA